MSLILPDSRLEMPELLHSGRKPVGATRIGRWIGRRPAAYILTGPRVIELMTNTPLSSAVAISGNALNFNGSEKVSTGLYLPLGVNDEWSAAYIGDCNDIGYVFLSRNGSNRHWGLYADNGKFGANPWNSTSRSSTTNTGPAVRAVSATSPTSGGTCDFYLNGVPNGTGTNVNRSGSLVSTTIGGREDEAGSFAGKIELVVFWPYRLTDEEQARFAANPYQFLVPA